VALVLREKAGTRLLTVNGGLVPDEADRLGRLIGLSWH
jgi:hypothetical protein